ncbi:MAG: hypothetical protein IH945_10335, partial [Armatimonadetes bacterium]|nr:hypothetical protein [Armatimonadota bacterium]
MIRPRSLSVLIFALVGAWVSATYMPALLDWVFAKVEEANFEVPDERLDTDGVPSEESLDAESEGAESEDGGSDLIQERPPSGASDTDVARLAREQREGPQGPQPSGEGYSGSKNPAVIAAMALLGIIIGGGAGNLLALWWVRWAVAWDRMEIGDRVSFLIGVFAGIVASLPFILVFQGLGGVLAPLLTFALVLGFTTVSIYALKSMEEILPWQKQAISHRRTGRKILDTNL